MVYLFYTIIATLLTIAGYYSYRLFIISKNKIQFARIHEINDAVELCIISTEKTVDDQVSDYRKGWVDACVHIGVELGKVREEVTSEIKIK